MLLGPVLWSVDQWAAALTAATALFASATGARWHHDDLRHGGEDAQDARDRRTPLDAARRRVAHRRRRGGRWVTRAAWRSAATSAGAPCGSPSGDASGRHTLVVGATGSGKTVTQAWIAGRMIDAGHGAVVVDPKGDGLLAFELEHAARRARRTFRLWTPEGPGSTTRSRTAPTPSSPTRSWPARPTANRTTCARRSATSDTPSAHYAAWAGR